MCDWLMRLFYFLILKCFARYKQLIQSQDFSPHCLKHADLDTILNTTKYNKSADVLQEFVQRDC